MISIPPHASPRYVEWAVNKNNMKIQRQFNPKYKGHPGVKIPGESCTQPDQSMSLEQLLKNHTRGIPSDVQHRNPIFSGDEILNQHMDLNELEDLRIANRERTIELNKKIKDEQNEAKELRDAITASKANTKETYVETSEQQGMAKDRPKTVDKSTEKP